MACFANLYLIFEANLYGTITGTGNNRGVMTSMRENVGSATYKVEIHQVIEHQFTPKKCSAQFKLTKNCSKNVYNKFSGHKACEGNNEMTCSRKEYGFKVVETERSYASNISADVCKRKNITFD